MLCVQKRKDPQWPPFQQGVGHVSQSISIQSYESLGTAWHGLRSSRPKVISPEVILPETKVKSL